MTNIENEYNGIARASTPNKVYRVDKYRHFTQEQMVKNCKRFLRALKQSKDFVVELYGESEYNKLIDMNKAFIKKYKA